VKVSVIMPTYGAAQHIRSAIDSILDQTFTDWEMLIVNDPAVNDTTEEIVAEYSAEDSRIQLIQNTNRLGLAGSLNKGIRIARGEYIARMDADDISAPERLEKEAAFLDNNPDIGLVGSYQKHFGTEDYIHAPPITPESLKVKLIFECDLCHSTVMFRRDLFISNNLFYDETFLAEDFELWTRAVQIMKFATIPEVLGFYRHSDDNITESKKQDLAEESGEIVAKSLKGTLNIELNSEDKRLFEGWHNVFYDTESRKERRKMLRRYTKVLLEIRSKNSRLNVYSQKQLNVTLLRYWLRAAIVVSFVFAGLYKIVRLVIPKRLRTYR